MFGTTGQTGRPRATGPLAARIFRARETLGFGKQETDPLLCLREGAGSLRSPALPQGAHQVALLTHPLSLPRGFRPVGFPAFLLDLTLLVGEGLTGTAGPPPCPSFLQTSLALLCDRPSPSVSAVFTALPLLPRSPLSGSAGFPPWLAES